MKQLIWITWREMRERLLLLWSGVLVGGLALMTPYLPSLAAHNARGEALSAGALIAAGTLGLTLAAGLGASLIGADLTHKRLGFYLAQPIPGWSLWGGKMLGAVLLALLTCGLALLPVMIVVGGPQAMAPASGLFMTSSSSSTHTFEMTFITSPTLLSLLCYSIVTTVVIAHAIGVAVRARSRWLVLDLTGPLAVGYFSARAFASLNDVVDLGNGFPVLFFTVLAMAAVAIPLSFLVAGALQTVRGRSDLQRGHRVLSITLWGLLITASASAFAYTEWLFAANADDLRRVEDLSISPEGSWLAVRGTTAGRGQLRSSFLLEPETGRSLRIQLTSIPVVVFSEDGGTAAWIEFSRGDRRQLETIAWADLEASPPVVRNTPIVANVDEAFCLSPDGTRLGLLTRRGVEVHDLASGRPLLAQTLERKWFSCHFADTEHLHFLSSVYSEDRQLGTRPTLDFQISELDVLTHSIRVTGGFKTAWYPLLKVGPGLDLILSVSRDATRLLDGATGEEVAQLAAGGPRSVGYLTQDRVVVADGQGVHLYDKRGTHLRSLDLPEFSGNPSRLIVGGQPTPNTLLVGRRAVSRAVTTTYLLNLETGEIEATIDGLQPPAWPIRLLTGLSQTPDRTVRSLASRLLVDPDRFEMAAWSDSGVVPIVPRQH